MLSIVLGLIWEYEFPPSQSSSFKAVVDDKPLT